MTTLNEIAQAAKKVAEDMGAETVVVMVAGKEGKTWFMTTSGSNLAAHGLIALCANAVLRASKSGSIEQLENKL